jgi:multidrug efflux system outer membrane protein
LSRLRFDNGIASYLEVLIAENDLFSAGRIAVRRRADRYAERINVYQAFGGWFDLADPSAPLPKAPTPTSASTP